MEAQAEVESWAGGGSSGGPVPSPRGSSQGSDEQRVAVLTGVDKDAPSQKPGARRTLWEMRTTPAGEG